MKKIITTCLFSLALLACGASLNGPATAVTKGSCAGHVQCGTYCCTAAGSDGEGWECGGTWPDCPADSCCYTGEDVGPGDENAGVMGARKKPRVKRVVKLEPIAAR